MARLSTSPASAALAGCLFASSSLSGGSVAAEDTAGVRWTGAPGVTETVEQIMARERLGPRRSPALALARERYRERELDRLVPPRRDVPAPAVSRWPPLLRAAAPRPYNPQIVGTSFLGAELSDTAFAIPPDSMGDVGPTQIMVAVNGRIRVFDKNGGLGGLNTDTDNFFASVGGLDFATADPHVRYDRLSGRWFVTMIDLGAFGGLGIPLGPNGVMIAVSSGPTITSASSFTFFRFVQDLVGPTPNPDTDGFADYDTLGVDKFALYIGVNVFTQDLSAFVGTTGFVVSKADLIADTLTVTPFRQLAGNTCSAGAGGPFAPQGVNNDDPAATEGYFIGADLCLAGTLTLRRISTPGGTPTISGNILLSVPATSPPIQQVQPSPSRTLDGLDERLLGAMIHANKITGARTLWTSHTVQVDTSGVAIACGTPGVPPYPLCPNGRNGTRWYEIGSLTTTPALVQAGTLFDPAVTNPFGYWMASVAMSGQGHVALASSRAGLDPVSGFAGVAAAGRLRPDAPGSTQAATLAQSSSTLYNVEPSGPQRWGDFSQTAVDPTDDMTVWTFQEYCNKTNSWGVRAIQLRAPPPATPNCVSPAQVTMATQNVTITGTSVSGSEFFDPGPDSGGPGYNRLQASVSGGVTVNSVTFNSPTSVTLNVTVTSNGLKSVTFTNPDGQSVTGNNCINVNVGATVSADLAVTKTDLLATEVPGTSVSYTIVASNAGPNPASGAAVTDTPPAAITGVAWTCVGAGGATCGASGTGAINDAVILPVGGTATYTMTGTISPSATGTLSNTATVTAPSGVTDPTPGNNSATDTDTLALQADLSITKSDGQVTEIPGTSVTYTIVASNPGPSTVTGATVADTVPAAITGVTWTCAGGGGGTCAPSGSGNISQPVNLPVGAMVTFTLTGTISPSATGTLSNTATVTAPGGVTDPVPGNNSATDTDSLGSQADLSITKSDGQTTEVPGTSVTYTIVAANAGPNAATGATVTDVVPATIAGASWTCVGSGGGTCAASGTGNINQSVNLPVGATVTFTLTGTISASATGTLNNTAAVTAPGGVTDPTPGNNSATDTDTLTPQADLSITKTDGQTTEVPGTSVSYTIMASNAGPSAAPGAVVTDTVPASITSATWTCVGAGGGTCASAGAGSINDTANLPVGATATYTLTGTVSLTASSPLSNTATVAAPAGVTDPSAANNTATDVDKLPFACGAEVVIVPDGRVTADVLPAGATRWYGVSVRIGNAYSVEFKNATGAATAPGTLTVFAGDDGCGGTSTLATIDTAGIDPAGSPGVTRASFTAVGTATLFRMRLVNGAGSPVPLTFSASDTTMFSPAWSTSGAFNTYYSFQNTTGSSLSGTLTLLDTGGAVLASVNVTAAAGQTVGTNTLAMGVPRNRTGTARFTHGGPPGAFLPEAAIANFSISPAFVQPVKFQAQREAR